MTEQNLRQTVAGKAMSWLGLNEADGSFRKVLDVYNVCARRVGLYIMTERDPWCAAFVSAVAEACSLTDIIFPECHCERMISLYKRAGHWKEDDAYSAQIGDLIMYDWQDSGAGDCTGEADHVGLIVAVSTYAFTVIEGNSNDRVQTRVVQRNSRYIRGFCLPDYASKCGEVAAVPESGTSTKDDGAVPDAGSPAGNPTLRRGSKGAAVAAMQGALIWLGYGCGPDGADGDFGPNTAGALLRFQEENGLAADEICRPATWAKLLGVTA